MIDNRNYGIDFLRGIAIIGMVLAAVIPWTADFPRWMYHAQVGPPDFKFNPETPGITWVDLVFPFFLFAMGATFPLALQRKLADKRYGTIILGLLRRGILLLFFAIILAYLTPENLTAEKWINYLTALTAFAAFFLVFMRFKGSALKRYGLQALGFLTISILVYYHSVVLGNTFDKTKSNIIILVLAHMAVFGSIAWLLTASNVLTRLAILIAFAGVWLTRDIAGSWTGKLWDFHPSIQWFYSFSFLKYLCIVLPGSILGDILVTYSATVNNTYVKEEQSEAGILSFLSFVFVVFHILAMYTRALELNLAGHILFGILFYLFFKRNEIGQFILYNKLIGWGFGMVSIALFFEPLDGGIKKDPSSFSYWLLSSGLAFIFYVVCDYMTKRFRDNKLVAAIVKNGQNPMLAYSVSAFCITPVLGLLYVLPLFDRLAGLGPYWGLIKTALYVSLMILITNVATNRKWFWRS